jgi:hypothetical protein
MSFRSRKTDKVKEAQERLARAESAAQVVEQQGNVVGAQLSLVARLSDGWRRVHETNHLAELFQQEYGGTRQ